MTESIRVAPGGWGDYPALIISFEIVNEIGVLRDSRDYSLTYIPELDEWHGDVIASGEWLDLDQDEILELRITHHLDETLRKSII